MSNPRKPVGRHELSAEEKARIKAEAEAAYREEVAAQVRAEGGNSPTAAPQTTKAGSKPSPLLWAGLGVVGLAVIAGVVSLSSSRTRQPAVTQTANPQVAPQPVTVPSNANLSGMNATFIREKCAESVRNQLKAPATAQFNDVKDPMYLDGKWGWESYVDAQNSYGALIRTNTRCTIMGNTTEDAVINAELADSDGNFPSDIRAQRKADEVAAAGEAQEAINLCLGRIRKNYPTTEDREYLHSCFGAENLLTLDEELSFKHLVSLNINTGIDGKELEISAETSDSDPHSWTWKAGKIEQDY